MTESPRPWIAILAGGDGRRMQGAIVGGQRLDRPKQFCSFRGETLLERTLRRARHITEPERTIVVVRDDHRHWWERELESLPGENILLEAANRGTAVAILHAVLHVLQRDENPVLVVLPSDHSADREAALVASVSRATRWAAAEREHLVLLGITPDRIETDYGWILPGEPDQAGRMVERFVEKPPADLARELLAAGALWNSFIFAGMAHLVLDLFQATKPRLVSSCFRRFTAQESRDIHRRGRFLALPSVDFCRDVLPSVAARLRILDVPACGWTDLGTPYRVREWLKRSSSSPPVSAPRDVERRPLPESRAAITSP